MKLLPAIQVHEEPPPDIFPFTRVAKADFSTSLVGPGTRFTIRHGLGGPVFVRVNPDPHGLPIEILHENENVVTITSKAPFTGTVHIFKS